MKLTVFGTNATCPEADGACSCFLAESAHSRLLLDMGNASLTKLQQKLDLAALDGIFISHFHFDHVGDLFCAKYQLETRRAYGEAIPPIPLFAPAMPAWAAAELATNGVFEISELSAPCSFVFRDMKLSFQPMPHLIESFGIRIEADGEVFAYSGDTGACSALTQLAARADLFLCEATFPSCSAAECSHHLSAEHAAEAAKAAGAAQLLLTHYHSADAAESLALARGIFPHTGLSEILHSYPVRRETP